MARVALAGAKWRLPSAARAELIAALRMPAKSHDTAALLVERHRARVNLLWDDLLIPPETESVSEAA
jgi:hypothetical protein